jgi:hypothetical protein
MVAAEGTLIGSAPALSKQFADAPKMSVGFTLSPLLDLPSS